MLWMRLWWMRTIYNSCMNTWCSHQFIMLLSTISIILRESALISHENQKSFHLPVYVHLFQDLTLVQLETKKLVFLICLFWNKELNIPVHQNKNEMMLCYLSCDIKQPTAPMLQHSVRLFSMQRAGLYTLVYVHLPPRVSCLDRCCCISNAPFPHKNVVGN